MQLTSEMLADIWKRRKSLLLWPAATLGVIALLYSLVTPKYWSATQALYVRDEGVGRTERLGRFESVDAMQTAQETIMEVARHQTVLSAALSKVGPETELAPQRSQQWPGDRVIDAFRSQVFVTAPNGAQFGRTELIYLTVHARTADRAYALTDAVTEKLVDRMQTLRREKYQGIVRELEENSEIARAAMTAATKRLHGFETEVGIDLAELRVLMNEGQGDGTLRRSMSEITHEIRQAENKLIAKQLECEQLETASKNPRSFIGVSNQALDSQPLLKRLKEGLVDAQLQVSRISSELSPDHPRSKAAIQSEAKIRTQLLEQIHLAVGSLRNEMEVLQDQIGRLKERQSGAESRLHHLADLRTRYGAALADVKQRTTILDATESDLAHARANLMSATASSLIQRVDVPVKSSQPMGPSRKVIVLGGVLAGFAAGLGLIFLLEPMEASTRRRRQSDAQGFGRRATDAATREARSGVEGADRRRQEAVGRRQADHSPAAPLPWNYPNHPCDASENPVR